MIKLKNKNKVIKKLGNTESTWVTSTDLPLAAWDQDEKN